GRTSPDGVTSNAVFAQQKTFDVTTGAEMDAGIPSGVLLNPVRPTPSRGLTSIAFSVPLSRARADYDLSVFDLAGRRVAVVERGQAAPGHHTCTWDLRGRDGSPVRNGVYFVRLSFGQVTLETRAIVLR